MSTAPVTLIKAHAYGNDFLLAERADIERLGALADVTRRVCARHTGIGADGLMLMDLTGRGAVVRLRNADGSRSEISGNGIRCVAAWLARLRDVPAGDSVLVETEAGDRQIDILARDHGRVTCRANMGVPTGVRQVALDAAGERVQTVVLNIGNPQCVVLVPPAQLTQERLHAAGAALAVHPYFPEGTNVELAAVMARGEVRILIWERGVGPTESSGTGTCAAAIAAVRYGGAASSLEVTAPGGVQHVDVSDEGTWLTGTAEVVGRVEWWGAR